MPPLVSSLNFWLLIVMDVIGFADMVYCFLRLPKKTTDEQQSRKTVTIAVALVWFTMTIYIAVCLQAGRLVGY